MNLKKLLVAAAMTLVLPPLFAQSEPQQPQMPPLPIDTAVRMGTLPNGLTYFIRHNQNPKERAHFYIAQRVGSILEEDSQSGLAHFLEHMAFNGTKNFPGKNLISYLEENGVRFGANLNAYTGFDETVYTLMDVPSNRSGIIDSCLLILHDWSHFISLEEKEIDNERGVIHEEWRQGNNASMRMFTTILPRIFPNNRYGQRLPIGSMDVVDHFSYKELRDYYHKWYRPDLQGLIIVGDIDVDYVENKIKEMFKDVPKPVNPAPREYLKVEDNKEPIVVIATDSEATSTILSINFKVEPLSREQKGTIYGMVQNYLYSIVQNMMNDRFHEITIKPNAPFMNADISIGMYMGITPMMDAISISAQVKEGGLNEALIRLAMEIERVRQHGFTESEYDRARTNLLKAYENSYKERSKRKNGTYADEYKNYFTRGGYIPGIETEYKTLQQLAPNIPIQAVNQIMKEGLPDTENLVIFAMGPKKDNLKYPTEAELLKVFQNARKIKVDPYKEQKSNEKLMTTMPKPGKVVTVKENLKYGMTEWTLSNGAKVYLKKTDHKENEIRMNIVSFGGYLPYLAKDLTNMKVINDVAELGGLGNFDQIALKKALTGRTASISPAVNMTTENISGRSTTEDLETLMQLIHLQFTAQRIDKEAFEAYKQRSIEELQAAQQNPLRSFADSLMQVLYPGNKYMTPLKAEDLEKVNYERCMQIFKERFSNAGDFNFFFVGNIDEAKMKTLVEQYIASLPASGKKEKPALDKVFEMSKGTNVCDYKKDLDTPMAMVLNVINGRMPYNLKNAISMNVLVAVMNQMYLKSIREDEGGTYGVSVGGKLERLPVGEAAIEIFYRTAPEKVDHLNSLIFKEYEEMLKNGLNKEYFAKTIENMKKDHAEKLVENGYWLNNAVDYIIWNKDFVTNYEKELNAITPESVRKFAEELYKQKNVSKIILRSTKTEKDIAKEKK